MIDMKAIVPFLYLILFSNWAYSQIDTAALMKNVKIHLVDEFDIGMLNSYQYESYCKLPLKFEAIQAKNINGFNDGIVFLRIPEQILYYGNDGKMKLTPISSFIDSPFTSSFLVAIEISSGKTYPLLGFSKNRTESFIYALTDIVNVRKQKRELEARYKIGTFHFEIVKGELQLLSDNLQYSSSPYLKSCFDSVSHMLNK